MIYCNNQPQRNVSTSMLSSCNRCWDMKEANRDWIDVHFGYCSLDHSWMFFVCFTSLFMEIHLDVYGISNAICLRKECYSEYLNFA
ncbi:CLUMA_CG001500, isoform A [Clunio marinus]|uniref:CLUMA_CG001500, isoform A n=1 Tax=Clunio marinus TaxID=568069 RepID=A0A1J1HMM0_9DIPT|nr:CLUMA_CG001500, isoform A [Clunio marinus]